MGAVAANDQNSYIILAECAAIAVASRSRVGRQNAFILVRVARGAAIWRIDSY